MLLQLHNTVRSTFSSPLVASRAVRLPTRFVQPSSAPPPLSRMFALTPYKKEQTKTLERQRELPRLPIPPLEKSLERYIKSLRPLLLEQALKAGQGQDAVDAELAKRREWAADFQSKSGLGRLLQERLKGEQAVVLGGECVLIPRFISCRH